MTTIDLEIKDPHDGKLNACAHALQDKGVVTLLTEGPGSVMELAPDGAEELIRWLSETFGFLPEVEPEDVLRIVVPGAAGGEPREVTWSGQGEPPAWFAGLAELALTGQLQRRVDQYDTAEDERWQTLVRMVRSLGMRRQPTVLDEVAELVEAFRSMRKQVAVGAIATTPERATLRDLMAELGIDQSAGDRYEQVLSRVREMLATRDTVEQAQRKEQEARADLDTALAMQRETEKLLAKARAALHDVNNMVANMGNGALPSHQSIQDRVQRALVASNPDA